MRTGVDGSEEREEDGEQQQRLGLTQRDARLQIHIPS